MIYDNCIQNFTTFIQFSGDLLFKKTIDNVLNSKQYLNFKASIIKIFEVTNR